MARLLRLRPRYRNLTPKKKRRMAKAAATVPAVRKAALMDASRAEMKAAARVAVDGVDGVAVAAAAAGVIAQAHANDWMQKASPSRRNKVAPRNNRLARTRMEPEEKLAGSARTVASAASAENEVAGSVPRTANDRSAAIAMSE